MTNGFRDSSGEHSHRKTRPVINVSLITLTFLQVDFHTYPIILPCLRSCLQTAVLLFDKPGCDDVTLCISDCILEMS